MYDIHNHIIPGVDDGARDLDESLAMIKQYIASGFTGIIATSHYDKGRYLVTRDQVEEGVAKIKKRLEEENIDFEIYPGNEIQIDMDSIKDINANKVMRLNDTRYVLCELPMMTKPNYAENIFYEMQLNGWIPIIAHAERYSYVQDNPDWLLKFIKTGCLVQMNLSSLTRSDSKAVSEELLKRNMVHIIGTDAHQSEWRSPNVVKELDILRNLVDEEKFEILTETNPKKVINNQHIPAKYNDVVKNEVEEIMPKKEKKKWFKFW